MPFLSFETVFHNCQMKLLSLSNENIQTGGMVAHRKKLAECREYHDPLAIVAEQAIPFDLDDGVVVNYAKLSDVVMKLK